MSKNILKGLKHITTTSQWLREHLAYGILDAKHVRMHQRHVDSLQNYYKQTHYRGVDICFDKSDQGNFLGKELYKQERRGNVKLRNHLYFFLS